MLTEAWVGYWPYYADQWTFLALQKYKDTVPGCDKSHCVSLAHHGEHRVFFSEQEIKQAQRFNLEFLADEGRMAAFSKSAEDTLAEISQETASLKALQADELSSLELAALFEQTGGAVAAGLAHCQLSNPGTTDLIWKELRAWLGSTGIFDPGTALDSLTASSLASLDSFQEQKAWLEICEAKVRGLRSAGLSRAFSAHAERFGFLGRSYRRPQGFVESDYRRRLTADVKEGTEVFRQRLENFEKRSVDCERVAMETASRLQMPPRLFRLSRSIAYLSLLRIRINEYLRDLLRAREPYMTAILSLFVKTSGDVPEYLFSQLKNEEIAGALRDGKALDSRALELRWDSTLITLKGSKCQELAGELALEAASRIQFKTPDTKAVLHGVVASGSRLVVVGQAKVLTSGSGDSDGARKAGEVIITAALKPEHVPDCVGAAAILAEDGGITSHAAVVARELGIPCIVGVGGLLERVSNGSWVRISIPAGRIEVAEQCVWDREDVSASRPASRKRAVDKEYRPAPTLEDPADVVLALGDAGCRNPARVGQKAANLHRIADLTPAGCVLPVGTIARNFPPKHSGQTDAPNLTLTTSPGFIEGVSKYFERLKFPPVAVRSSSPMEGGSRSFSGLFTSCLNVDSGDPAAVHRAIEKVAQSTFSAGVQKYQTAFARTQAPLPMAVLIQTMVPAIVSGMARTSVKRGRKSHLCIEFTSGPLDNLVAGKIVPLRAFVSQSSVADREAIRSRLAERLVPATLQSFIDPAVINRLGALLAGLEEAFGHSQEVEWAVDTNNKVWILQTSGPKVRQYRSPRLTEASKH